MNAGTAEVRSRGSSVGITTGYGLDGRGSIPGRGKGFVSSPQGPDRLWDLPSLLSSVYRGLLPQEHSGQGVMLTTLLHLVSQSQELWSCTSTPRTSSWRAAYLIKYRDNFTLITRVYLN
jgi:hypothetical protein